MTKQYIINAGIQIVPINIVDPSYAIIDKAIDHIRQSGLEYTITPFETVVNGTTDQVLALIAELKQLTENNGADELIINIRMHSKAREDNKFESKIS